jgi:hypothetical protein
MASPPPVRAGKKMTRQAPKVNFAHHLEGTLLALRHAFQ